MIASLQGVIGHVGLDQLVVIVGGVGLSVHATPATAAAARRGSEVSLATTLIVREESLTLYGFATSDEKDMFDTAQSVSGVGPRIALAMLSVLSPDELRQALAAGDTKTLTRVPGIGPKSAQRLILELKDKVGPAATASGARGIPTPPTAAQPWQDQVSAALVGLGWSPKQADDTVATVARTAPEDAGVSDYLRLALRELRR